VFSAPARAAPPLPFPAFQGGKPVPSNAPRVSSPARQTSSILPDREFDPRPRKGPARNLVTLVVFFHTHQPGFCGTRPRSEPVVFFASVVARTPPPPPPRHVCQIAECRSRDLIRTLSRGHNSPGSFFCRAMCYRRAEIGSENRLPKKKPACRAPSSQVPPRPRRRPPLEVVPPPLRFNSVGLGWRCQNVPGVC